MTGASGVLGAGGDDSEVLCQCPMSLLCRPYEYCEYGVPKATANNSKLNHQPPELIIYRFWCSSKNSPGIGWIASSV